MTVSIEGRVETGFRANAVSIIDTDLGVATIIPIITGQGTDGMITMRVNPVADERVREEIPTAYPVIVEIVGQCPSLPMATSSLSSKNFCSR